jgi:predicted regulator of Ras-like GTPase activity (Roadblock/LC7/MglB family)
MGDELEFLIEDKLRAILTILPATIYSCIVATENGALVAKASQREILSPDLLGAISAIPTFSAQFSSTLSLGYCPCIHIKGERYVFSLYTIRDDLLLATCSDFDGIDVPLQLGALKPIGQLPQYTDKQLEDMKAVVNDIRTLLTHVAVEV